MAFAAGKSIPALIFDEIALEGLEGITVSGLWIRLSDSLGFPLPLLDKFKAQVWQVILQSRKHLEFYLLPEPREKLKVWDRYADLDPDYGLPVCLVEWPYTVYKCVPISDNGIYGSCETYDIRKQVKFAEVADMSVQEVEDKWGDTFIIVGSQQLRYTSLVPPNVTIPVDITPSQYCVLEFIGRSRKSGVTSAGPFSLRHCCKDAAIAFYIRNKLARYGLIMYHPYTEKRNDRLVGCSLMTLTRFNSYTKTAFTIVIEKIFVAIKNTRNHIMPVGEMKRMFPPENHTMIKKIAMTSYFKKFFETCNAPWSEVSKDRKPKNKYKPEPQIACVRVKNPNLSVEDLFAVEEEQKEDKETYDFYDYKHAYVDMPLMEELSRAVDKFGAVGCSQTQLCQILSVNRLNVRQAVKKALKDKLLDSYRTDVGRQRTRMFVASHYKNSGGKILEDNQKVFTDKLKCADEPNIPTDADPPLKDIDHINATVKAVRINSSKTIETTKQLERKQKIIHEINKLGLIQVPVLRHSIVAHEQKLGYKDEICNKSLFRAINRMQRDGILTLYEICLSADDNEYSRLYRYVTHPKITPDHYAMQQEIIKLKNSLFLYIEEKKTRKMAERLGKEVEPKVVRVGLIPPGSHKSPKFLTARFMHEFMFYMGFVLKPNQGPVQLTRELLQNWLQSEPNLNVDELYTSMAEDHIYPYNEEISWKTFITPLPVYEDKPPGWIALPDVVERLPLSLFNKIVHVLPTADPEAMTYLSHPVRQHIMIKQMPLHLQSLVNRGRLNHILINIIKLLNRGGMIQLSEKGGKDALQMWIYLNQNAIILDTTTSEPGFTQINPKREYTEIKFHFQSFKDVQSYWNCLHTICVNTRLGFHHKKTSKVPAKLQNKRERYAINDIVSPVKNFDEAPLKDTGIPPGDRLGAGGLAAGLYSFYQRNWSWLVNNKHTAAAMAPSLKLKTSLKFQRTKMSKLLNRPKKSDPAHKTITQRAIRFAATPAGRIVKRKVTTVKTKTKFPVDAVDRDAIREMRTLRARWTHKEDTLLKMGRAVFLFLSVPVVHFNLRDVARVMRDINRVQGGVKNKTTAACHRRIHFLVKTNRHLPELPTWLHALQTNEHLTARYDSEKFCNELRQLYSNRSELMNAIAVHFIYVLGQLQIQFKPTESSRNESMFPDTLAEFSQQYRECSPLNEAKSLLYSNPTTKLEIQLATINNLLHSSLCCTRDKTQYSLQIFEVYKNYPEDVLHAAFRKARAEGLVVSRKKTPASDVNTQLTGPSYTLSNKYRLSLMFLSVPYVIYDMHHAFFDRTLAMIFGAEPSPAEIRAPHSAQVLCLAELAWHDMIKINIRPPTKILTIDPTAQQTSLAVSERIEEHFQHLLQHAPETEYLKQFDACGELAARVKFKAANEMYKLYYHPFDVISKLNNVLIHFFCFLGNLNRSMDATFSRYDEETSESFCPFFDCVLKSENYLDTIEKIVGDRETILDKINEETFIEADIDTESVTISAENLMALFERFKTFLRGKLTKHETKDLGRSTLKRQSIDFLEICREISASIDDVQNDDQCEPTLNKEERIAKAQDVFVVNLPTLSLTANEEVVNGVEKTIYKETMVPDCLVVSDSLRDRVLKKAVEDSFWSYTQNSLDTLKPVMEANGYTAEEQKQVAKINHFIEAHNELGVDALELVARFPDVAFLQNAVKLLRQHFLVLRAGVSSFKYIPMSHVRSWVIHTRHIKRLEREALGRLVPGTSQKRKREKDNKDPDQPAAKQSKSGEEGCRVPKPVERFENLAEVTTTRLPTPNDPKEMLVFRPRPWIRVNGSLNRRVLDKWLASIVIECMAQSGITVHGICVRFKRMHPTDIMFLLELLVDLRIVKLHSFKEKKAGLFSTYGNIEKFDGNEFTDPQKTYVVAEPDAITRMSVFIGDKLYRADFF